MYDRDELINQSINSINEAFDDIGDIPNAIIKSLDSAIRPKMELDEIKNIYTSPLDKVILRYERKTGNTFISGDFKVAYIDDEYYEVSYDLYFQDNKRQWIKQSSKSMPINSEKYLKPEAIKELCEKKTIIYEINPPSI